MKHLGLLGPIALCLVGAGCAESHRIGDHVLVEYDGQECPGFVIDRKSETRFRVHFDFEGYDWQDDVSVDRIIRRIVGTAPSCALPRSVRATLGLVSTPKARASPYKVGDRVRVRWRDSVYPATIMDVVAPDRVVVHYHGHEDVWDETIGVERIENERR